MSALPYRRVAASSGTRWIREAFRLLWSNPAPFILMGLLITLLGAVPLVNLVVMGMLLPALAAGMVHAAREQHQGRSARFDHLFEGFRRPGMFPRLLLLCLPTLAAEFGTALLAVGLIPGIIAAISEGEVDPQAIAAVAGNLPLFLLLVIALRMFAFAALLFAIPAVMLAAHEPLPAMRDSLLACRANLGAFLVFIGSLLGGLLLVIMLLGMLAPVLVLLALMALIFPLVALSMYVAFLQVFGSDEQQADPAATTGIEV
jgi:hypothetical protein